MATIPVTGILVDASLPGGTVTQLEAAPQPIAWPRGEDGRINLTVLKQNRAAANLTGGALVLAVRKYLSDASPTISRAATFTDATLGTAYFPIGSVDTISLVERTYHYDVQYIDSAGKRWQVVPASSFDVRGIVAQPGEAVTVPTSQQPLAQGPTGPQGPRGPTTIDVYDGSSSGAEAVLAQKVVYFGDYGATISVRLDGYGRGQVGNVLRVRVGGTDQTADGTVVLTSALPSGDVWEIFSASASVANPTGAQFVKVTLQTPGGSAAYNSAGLTIG